MKKIIMSAGFLAAMVATSCQNEELIGSKQYGNVVVNASTVNESRTYVEGRTIYWSEGDRLLAFGDDVLGSLTLVGEGESTDGQFVGYVNGKVENLEYLLYPADMVSYKDGKATITIGTIDKGASNAPMFTEWGSNVKFNLMTAMIRIQINNVPENNDDLEVSGTGIGTAVFENGSVEYTTKTNTIKVTGLEEGTNEICIPVFTSNSTAGNIDLTFKLAGATKTLSLPVAKRVLTAINVPVLTYNATNGELIEETSLPESESATSDFEIKTVTELYQFANKVNGGETYQGKTVALANDIDLDYMPWTPITGFQGTFDGGNHFISNLNVAVTGKGSAGLFENGVGATIKNLTLKNVNINSQWCAGAVVGYGMCSMIENCHVEGGTITSAPNNKDDANNVGGIVGYLSAEKVAYVKNCSVKDLTITAYRDLGGIVGTVTNENNPIVENNTVSNTTIIANQTSEYTKVKAPNAGRIVGRDLKGVELSSNIVGENVAVKTLVATDGQLDNALSYAVDGQTIELSDDIAGDVTVEQKQNVRITIEGQNHNFDGTITVNGKSSCYETAGLTIKSIKFNSAGISADAYINLGNGKSETRYTNHVTVQNCTFSTTSTKDVVAVKSYTGGDKNLIVDGCIVDESMHSMLQVTNVEEGMKIKGCDVYSKNGVNLNNTPNFEMSGCTFDTRGYAIRVGVNGSANTIKKTFNVSESTLKSACDDNEAVIVFRSSATYAELTLNKTSVIGNVKYSGETTATKIVEN